MVGIALFVEVVMMMTFDDSKCTSACSVCALNTWYKAGTEQCQNPYCPTVLKLKSISFKNGIAVCFQIAMQILSPRN